MKTNRKKLRLDIDALKVEAFDTADGVAHHGTVHGHESLSCFVSWCEPSCHECPSEGSCSGPQVCLCGVTEPETCPC